MRTIVILMLACLVGCKPVPIGFDAPSEFRRMDAVVEAAAKNDQSPATIRSLIEQLDSFDPAMRMLSIRTLERLTGQTLGYDTTAPDWDRNLAVERWVAWYHETYPAEGNPSSAHAGTVDE